MEQHRHLFDGCGPCVCEEDNGDDALELDDIFCCVLSVNHFPFSDRMTLAALDRAGIDVPEHVRKKMES